MLTYEQDHESHWVPLIFILFYYMIKSNISKSIQN
jgi:hypothetical protein